MVLELVKGLALVGFNHIRDKLLGVDVENLGFGAVGQQLVANGVHQVGLAQTDATIDEQGVVQVTGLTGHVHGRSTRHAVGGALDQGIKSQGSVEPAAEGVGHRLFGGFHHLGGVLHRRWRGLTHCLDAGFTRSDR